MDITRTFYLAKPSRFDFFVPNNFSKDIFHKIIKIGSQLRFGIFWSGVYLKGFLEKS